MPLVTVKQVSKQYHQNSIVVDALDGVDLNVDSAEFMALVGPSGSGKTTLLNIIGGLDAPTRGQVWIREQEIGRLPKSELSRLRLREIGFIFQEYNLIPVLSAVENVEYVMLLQGVPDKERRERAESMLGEVGLKDFIHRRPTQLSGGQQQRVAVARAIVSQPAIVLADEPTANLDSHTGAALLDLMRDLNERHKTTFIFSTHDSMVMERARRIVTLLDGKIVDDRRQMGAKK
ncbi:ABC-type antimicrobial peptide transport system, ATPase component [hydrothermal vent metagenome]|uniref:ABC-type antimicrobial peptide transport system, ATPase component n=1 Tax=hydrothermal vent metagenome TaxID=652676 RepID=A0A3B0ZGW6_9ZZZZ